MDLAEIIQNQRALEFPFRRRRRSLRPRLRRLRAVPSTAAERARAARRFRILTVGITGALREKLFPLLRRLEGEFLLDGVRLQDDFADDIQAVLEQIRNEHLELAGRRASVLASDLTDRVNEQNRQKFYASVESVVGVNLAAVVDEGKLTRILKLKTSENVSLIKSIPEDYFKQIETLVYENVIQGRTSAKSMIEELRELGAKTDRRAKFIARDQTAKLNAALNRERNQALGITEYVWKTSRDERVRESHRKRNGKTFRWDDPPSGGAAAGGHPGESVNCRCVAFPKIVV